MEQVGKNANWKFFSHGLKHGFCINAPSLHVHGRPFMVERAYMRK
jgi:hypothetical protein